MQIQKNTNTSVTGLATFLFVAVVSGVGLHLLEQYIILMTGRPGLGMLVLSGWVGGIIALTLLFTKKGDARSEPNTQVDEGMQEELARLRASLVQAEQARDQARVERDARVSWDVILFLLDATRARVSIAAMMKEAVHRWYGAFAVKVDTMGKVTLVLFSAQGSREEVDHGYQVGFVQGGFVLSTSFGQFLAHESPVQGQPSAQSLPENEWIYPVKGSPCAFFLTQDLRAAYSIYQRVIRDPSTPDTSIESRTV